jgi:hypothetical protein
VNYFDPQGLLTLHPEIQSPNGYPGGGGGCGAVLTIAADPESGAPAGIECLFQTFGITYSGGGGGSGNKPDCSSYTSSQVSFVKKFSGTANLLGSLAGVPGDWVLAWAALESGWGTGRAVTGTGPAGTPGNNNYFSWTGKGNTQCPPTALPGFGCFSSDDPFLFSGNAALFGYSKYLTYNGQTGGTYGDVLQSQFDAGASITQAFTAVAQSGFDRNDVATYGAGVATRDAQVIGIELCDILGLLP